MSMSLVERLKRPESRKHRKYSPHRGYIGNQELRVPNYLFSSRDGETGYSHSRGIVDLVLNRSIEEQYRRSRALTDFLRKREMTFSKQTKSGQYRIFTVPCTNTPVPLPKTTFNSLERSAQILVASLRLVLQDIYGSSSVRTSAFVQSLPEDVRKIFITAVEKSPHYFHQLHHPAMRQYPFFDVVGLDLVLTEDYPSAHAVLKTGPRLVGEGEPATSELPFRLLEINAGSPSGASNNFHIMEGLSRLDPEMLQKLGKVMPNDHFEVLGETYRSLGSEWTGREDGVQIVLPPGGENGAAPEIHQLAAYSGLVYADAGQLYRDADGCIRLRTVSGSDPVVTAIYSRVNSDSALFDKGRKLFLRDAESGKPLHMTDPFDLSSKPKALKNAGGEPIPLESHYAIPGAIEAIHERKLYLGGLNRVLDNKIILSALCYYGPQFFRRELLELGMDPDTVQPVSPPETLPSTAEALKVVMQNPEDWVIKSPNLSGGKGVYILKTLSESERRQILAKAKADPKGYAYQKLVRIGRIPVAIKDNTSEKGEGFRYTNLAADLRMWAFYGAGPRARLPRVTHNALIRTAPVERGPLSSIVNTSKGGGYAPMVVVDDIGMPDSIPASSLVDHRGPASYPCDLPSFVGAQIAHVAEMVDALRETFRSGASAEAYRTYLLCLGIRKQCREVLSFIHPRNMESVNEMIEILEKKIEKTKVTKFFEKRNRLRVAITTLLHELEGDLPGPFFEKLDGIRAFNVDMPMQEYSAQDRAHDRSVLEALRGDTAAIAARNATAKKLLLALSQLTELRFPTKMLTAFACQALLFQLELFCMLIREHLEATTRDGKSFAQLFSRSVGVPQLDFDILFAEETTFRSLSSSRPALIATEEEMRTGKLLVETDFVAPELRAARADWMKIEAEAGDLPAKARAERLEAAREAHFAKHPVLAEYQASLDSALNSVMSGQPMHTGPRAILKLLEILPYARYNLVQYAKHQGLPLDAVFGDKLVDRNIALLTPEKRRASGLNADLFSGEAFARKRQPHGLFSDSQIYLWIATEISPLVQAYTVGHELVHFHQIRAMMEREQRALQEGPVEFAKFLNFFGNFLGLASGTLEEVSADLALDRKPVYGFADLSCHGRGKNWVADLKAALKAGSASWNRALTRYGSTLGYSTDISAQIKVKAIREVVPALENAKNIRFAKDLGLKLALDEIKSALPSANAAQVRRYKSMIERSVYSPHLDWEALRVIASHQYPGVRFARQDKPEKNLTLSPPLVAISLGGSYNQTQQQ